METAVYNTAFWRALPRDYCCVSLLLGPAVGECRGLIHHHHVDPDDPHSRTIQVCASHHPKIHKVLRMLILPRKTCRHRHPYPGGKEACEKRLNA